jgi:hypothetical protein
MQETLLVWPDSCVSVFVVTCSITTVLPSGYTKYSLPGWTFKPPFTAPEQKLKTINHILCFNLSFPSYIVTDVHVHLCIHTKSEIVKNPVYRFQISKPISVHCWSHQYSQYNIESCITYWVYCVLHNTESLLITCESNYLKIVF